MRRPTPPDPQLQDNPRPGAPDEPMGPIGGGALSVWLRTTFSSMSVRNYRLFFVGQGTSLTGTWVRRTALGWLIYEMTGSRAMLGTLMGLSLLPLFVLSPMAGAIADRVDKRRMIIITQIAASVTSAAIATLVLLDVTQPWHLMALAIVAGSAFAFEIPARQAYVVEMVGSGHLMNAIALNSALVNLSRIIGPAVAGLLMGTIGIAFCFVVDAFSYVAVIFTLLALRVTPTPVPPRTGSRWQELMAGYHEVHRNRRVRVLMLLLLLVGVFGWSCQTLMPAIAQDLLHMGELQYGLLMSMFGVGAIAGALVVASRSAREGTRLQVFGGVWILCAGALIVSASRSALPMGGGLAVAGFGAVMFMSTSNTLVQTGVDNAIRGRIMGIWSLGFGAALPAGAILSGWVAEYVSPYLTIAVFAGILAVSSALVWWRLPRQLPDTS